MTDRYDIFLQVLGIATLFLIFGLSSVAFAMSVRNDQLQGELTAINCEPEKDWVKLSGEWVATYYGTKEDGLLGERTGASWNDYDCDGVPAVVTAYGNGVAMPGAEFYCMSVKVCVGARCAEVVAVDVPLHDRLFLDGRYYNHVDLWYAPAERLGIVGTGIVTESVKVYVK